MTNELNKAFHAYGLEGFKGKGEDGEKGKGKGKGKGDKGGVTAQPKIPPHIGGWFNKLEAAGGRGRCRFWNAGHCIYGKQCNFEHRNLVDGSNRPAISTFAPGTAFLG